MNDRIPPGTLNRLLEKYAESCPHNGGPRPKPNPADGPVGTWIHCTIPDCPLAAKPELTQ